MENAVRHGISRLLEGGEIRVAAARHGSLLEIRVRNPCDPDRSSKMREGIGLTNVRKRLRTLYGSEAGLDVHRTDASFEAVVTLAAVQSRSLLQPASEEESSRQLEESSKHDR
jgi:LytS/YehU family sensor histidine kinase